MESKKVEETKKKMANIYTQIAERVEKTTEISNIAYYKQLAFDSVGFINGEAFVVKLREGLEGKDEIEFYEIYNQDGELIAATDQKGKLQFRAEFIEKLREDYGEYCKMLNLDNAVLELPQKTKEQDIILKPEELEREVKKVKEDEKKDDKEEEQEEKQEIKEEDQEQKEIAKKKGIPESNVLKVRDNSNLYKDHPEIERNLIFSRDNDGVIKAEYIDENGELQPSKYIMPSTTGIRQETVSIGSDGNPVTREVPYQVMNTQNLSKRDQDIRDIRINVKFDKYGYMDIEEARQGKNGEWAAHDIEVRGRNYNSTEVNEETSIRTGEADPDKETKIYGSVEKTGLVQDGVQYDEMYLMQHSNEIIEEFIKEGYQKEEAVQIFNYMIGEDALPKEEAKEKVNEEIKEKGRSIEERNKDEDEERTPWGDAEARDARR